MGITAGGPYGGRNLSSDPKFVHCVPYPKTQNDAKKVAEYGDTMVKISMKKLVASGMAIWITDSGTMAVQELQSRWLREDVPLASIPTEVKGDSDME